MNKDYSYSIEKTEVSQKSNTDYKIESQDEKRKSIEKNYPKNDTKRQFSIEEIRERLSKKNVAKKD